MPLSGAIAGRVGGLIPITLNALQTNPQIGDGPIQGAIDLAKEKVTGTVIAPNLEQNYPLVVIDYIAKVAVIEMSGAGIDFWMNQAMSVNSSGTNENASYIDRAKQLEDIKNAYIEETRRDQPEIAKILGYWRDNGRSVPQMSSASLNPYHLTPSPEEFDRPYRITQYS